jgi:hypothetical protein
VIDLWFCNEVIAIVAKPTVAPAKAIKATNPVTRAFEIGR